MNQNKLNLQELLKWGISNATAAEDPTIDKPDLEKLDPKWVDIILGKPDAVRMKDCMKEIQNESIELAVRIAAFDELELLVESIDNAMDLKPCGLWPPLISLLSHDEPQIRTYAGWVIGTAVQNNPKVMQDFINENGLPLLLNRLKVEEDSSSLNKLLLIVSSFVSGGLVWTAQLHQQEIISQIGRLLLPSTSQNNSKPWNSSVYRRIFRIFLQVIQQADQFHQYFTDIEWMTSVINTHLLLFLEKPNHTVNNEEEEDSSNTTYDMDVLCLGLEFVLRCIQINSLKLSPIITSSMGKLLSMYSDDLIELDKDVVNAFKQSSSN